MKKSLIALIVLIIVQSSLSAHSGGTDAKGGHNDRKNGGYHFHHGNGPHQHPGGICALNPKRAKKNNEEGIPFGQLVILGSAAAYAYSNRDKFLS